MSIVLSLHKELHVSIVEARTEPGWTISQRDCEMTHCIFIVYDLRFAIFLQTFQSLKNTFSWFYFYFYKRLRTTLQSVK